LSEFLESQLLSGEINLRSSIQRLATSDIFRSRNYKTNKLLFCKNVYTKSFRLEKYTVNESNYPDQAYWQLDLLNKNEYISCFSYNIFLYQRRNIWTPPDSRWYCLHGSLW